MAISKTITVQMQYQNNANSPVAVNYVVHPVVSGSNLTVGTRNVRPGVFTAGTPAEGTPSNPNNNGNQ